MNNLFKKVFKSNYLLKTRITVIIFGIIICLSYFLNIIDYSLAFKLMFPLMILSSYFCYKINNPKSYLLKK